LLNQCNHIFHHGLGDQPVARLGEMGHVHIIGRLRITEKVADVVKTGVVVQRRGLSYPPVDGVERLLIDGQALGRGRGQFAG